MMMMVNNLLNFLQNGQSTTTHKKLCEVLLRLCTQSVFAAYHHILSIAILYYVMLYYTGGINNHNRKICR